MTKTFLDTVLFLAWVSSYLAAVSWISRHRRMRAHALGMESQSDYRADKDLGLNLAIFALGIALFFLIFLAIRALGQSV